MSLSKRRHICGRTFSERVRQYSQNTMVLNPFLMNDWKLKAALKVVFVLLLTVWALVGLDVLGVHLPLLRGIFSVAFFLFIPGILILRALRAHRIGSERTLLFACLLYTSDAADEEDSVDL